MSVVIAYDASPDMSVWICAYRRDSQAIVAHPLFPTLVREVAIDEAPSHPGWGWLSRNSRTYASWMTRGMMTPRKSWSVFDRRSQRFAQRITDDLDILPGSPEGDRVARVYGEARDHVRLRLNGRP